MVASPPATLELTLPWPPRLLSPNARAKSAHEKASAVALYRRDCYILAVDAKNRRPTMTFPLAVPVAAYVEFIVPDDKTRRDMDNLLSSIKPAWDALTSAKVLKDDDWRSLKISMGVAVGPKREIHLKLTEPST